MSGSVLLAVADRLFGEMEPPSGPPRRVALRWLGVAMVLAAIIVARRLDLVTNPQFWAEDGYVYFFDNLVLGFPAAVAKLYQGFPHLLQRLIAFAGGLVPFAHAPRVYTTLSIAITALTLATFALPGFRHLVRSDGLRVLFGALVLCAPSGSEMVLATPANIGWLVAVWLSLISLMRLPAEPWRIAGLGVAGCVAVLSTPLAVVNVPLWVLRIWRGVVRHNRRELWFGLALLVCTGALMTFTHGLGRDARWQFMANPQGYLVRFVAFVLDRVAAVARTPALGGSVFESGDRVMFAWLAAAVAVPIGLSAATRFRTLPAVLAAMYLYAGSLFVCAAGRPTLLLLEPIYTPARYTVFPAAMLALALVALLDGVASRVVRRALTAVALAALGWMWGPRFLVPPLEDTHWAIHAEHLATKLAAGSHVPLVIPANPRWVPIEFDPIDWSADSEVPGETILGGLGPTGSFRQSFECHCNSLAAIAMRLAAEPSSRGALDVTVAESASRRVVARARVARADLALRGDWAVFPLEPVPESAGKSYIVTLRAVDNDVAAPVFVLGARGDRYPLGQAFFSGSVLDADASLRYACTRTARRRP